MAKASELMQSSIPADVPRQATPSDELTPWPPTRCWWRRLLQAGAVAAAAMLGSSGAMAFYDGNKLYNYCNAAMGEPELLFCQAYIAAMADAMGGTNTIFGFRACMASSATLAKAVDVTKQFLTAHPEIRHHEAAWLVAQAFAQAFPCQNGLRR